MASEPYNVGTITVAAGSMAVAGTETYWVGKARMNDMLMHPASGLQVRITADPTDNDVLAINAWPGANLTDAAYEIIPAADSTTSSARLRDLLVQLDIVQANGQGRFMRFSDSIADADPGAGYLRLNNLAVASATALYVDNLDANGAAIAGWIDTWDDSTSIAKGRVFLSGLADRTVLHVLEVTGAVVDGTGYRKVSFSYVGGSGSFAADDALMMDFAAKGDRGDGFVTNADVANPADLAAYETETAGFLVFVTDLQTAFGAYAGRSGVVRLIAGPAWEIAALYTGPQGAPSTVPGPVGPPGIVWVGSAWDAGTTYALNDATQREGSSWRSLQAGNLNHLPPSLPTLSNAWWTLVARRGIDGAGTVGGVTGGNGISVDSSDPTSPIVSAVIASEAEAEAGAANNVLMTPERTAQAIAVLSPPTDTSAIESNIAAMAFEIADLKGMRLNMVGGIADAYDSEADVDTVASTNAAYNAAGDFYSPSTTGGAISGATGSNIGDATSSGGLAAAFDGVTSGSAAADQVAALGGTSIYVGKSYSPAKKIAQAVVYGASDQGYVNSVNPNVTLTLYGKTGSAPSGPTDGTLLGTVTFPDENNVARAVTSSDTTTEFDHVWVRVNQSDSSQAMFIAEVIFYEPGTRNNMTLLSKAFTAQAQPDRARVALFVGEHESITINTDLIVEVTRDGATWTAAVLALVSNPVGSIKMYQDNDIDIVAQPSGTTMKYRTKTANGKYIDATGIVFQWK